MQVPEPVSIKSVMPSIARLFFLEYVRPLSKGPHLAFVHGSVMDAHSLRMYTGDMSGSAVYAGLQAPVMRPTDGPHGGDILRYYGGGGVAGSAGTGGGPPDAKGGTSHSDPELKVLVPAGDFGYRHDEFVSAASAAAASGGIGLQGESVGLQVVACLSRQRFAALLVEQFAMAREHRAGLADSASGDSLSSPAGGMVTTRSGMLTQKRRRASHLRARLAGMDGDALDAALGLDGSARSEQQRRSNAASVDPQLWLNGAFGTEGKDRGRRGLDLPLSGVHSRSWRRLDVLQGATPQAADTAFREYIEQKRFEFGDGAQGGMDPGDAADGSVSSAEAEANKIWLLHARGRSLHEVGAAVEAVLRRRPLLSMHALRNSLRVVRDAWRDGTEHTEQGPGQRTRLESQPNYANAALAPHSGTPTPR